MKKTREQKMFQQVINETYKNEAFKKELAENPEVAVKRIAGAKVRNLKSKNFLIKDEINEATMFINVPIEQTVRDVELNEEELALVSGGVVPLPVGDFQFINDLEEMFNV